MPASDGDPRSLTCSRSLFFFSFSLIHDISCIFRTPDSTVERDFGFSRLWGPTQFRVNRGFAARRRAFPAYEAHHPIVRECSEHLRALDCASVVRRVHYTAHCELRSTTPGRRCASVRKNYKRVNLRNRPNSINFACFLIGTPISILFKKYG